MKNRSQKRGIMGNSSIFTLAILFLLFTACNSNQKKQKTSENQNPEKSTQVNHPEWSKNAVIYEVNIRQYTEEGTFEAFEEHLPRLKELGVDILWLMPIHPIGEKNRKGTLGSYYSVKDYKGINPNFGNKKDFRELVDKIHNMDMKIILDWVANHSAWDNKLIKKHPEWYTTDSSGNFQAPVDDWTDVADLNYDNQKLQKYMTGAMKYWVKKFDIDGYRCDVAGMVPVSFWNNTHEELDKIKDVFMLAEANDVELHNRAFDMTYAWDLHFLMNDVAKGKKNANDLAEKMKNDLKKYPANAYRMMFTSNHDENTWKGTVDERLKGGVKNFAMLTYTLPGMPLIYSGQEACLDKRLKFFEKDQIEWKSCEMTQFYQKLNKLKKKNIALWNGKYGGSYERIETNADNQAYVFVREKKNNKILVITNISDKPVNIELTTQDHSGEYTEYFTQEETKLSANSSIKLEPWEFKILIKQ
jgi:glycosidase